MNFVFPIRSKFFDTSSYSKNVNLSQMDVEDQKEFSLSENDIDFEKHEENENPENSVGFGPEWPA
mgnify:CR=1 FL=1